MKVWYITGASTGLGRKYAEAVLDRGDCAAVASIDPENMEDYKRKYKERVLVQHLDVTRLDMVKKRFKEAVDYFGHIDVCVNNAGYMQMGAVEEMSETEVRKVFDCNFFGTLFVTQQAAEHMRERRSGTIVQIASLAAVDTIAGEGLYGATKHAVLGMSEALYHELKPFNVRVVVVEPGVIKTDMPKRAKLCERRIPDYEEILESETKRWGGGIETEEDINTGDPANCAQVLLSIVDSDNPPREIVFTSFAYEILRITTAKRLEEANKWRMLSARADTDYCNDNL